MSADTQISLPITGMTCANCVSTVERNIKKVEGVQVANVNLTTERAAVEYDSHQATLSDLVERIERAGYGIATGEADLIVHRMSDDNDARRLEKSLLNLEGVLVAQVSFTSERAKVKYIPTVISQAEIRHEVAKAGFEPIELGGKAEDVERIAREAEIATQRRLLIAGLIFTLSLSSLTVSLLRHYTPMRIRMMAQTLIIASYVIMVDIAIRAYLPDILETPDKGVFVDIIRAIDSVYEGNIERSVYPFPRSLNNVISEKADFHLPMIRNKLVPVESLPYAYTTEKMGYVCFVIYSHKDNPITVKKLQETKKMDFERVFTHNTIFPKNYEIQMFSKLFVILF